MRPAAWLMFVPIVVCARHCALAEPLAVVGEPTVDAQLISTSAEGVFNFRVTDKQRTVTAQQLVRWSARQPTAPGNELILLDGSRIKLATAWPGKPVWSQTPDGFTVSTKLLDEIAIALNRVHAIIISPPRTHSSLKDFTDQLLSPADKHARIVLSNGDQFDCRQIVVQPTDQGVRTIEFQTADSSTNSQVAEDRVAALVFPHSTHNNQPAAKLAVGLRDGSILMASSVVADESQMQITLPDGTKLVGTDRRDVVSLRSLISDCVYLSDVDADSYRHVPYLDLQWPYSRDHNVFGGLLQTGNQVYVKGLGVPTAARLTYRLDEPKLANRKQLVAQVAVDDTAGRRGSVVFRVYLLKAGQWQQAYESPVVRGGEPPLPVAIDLDNASQLALATDFADRGDELDYANWLEARLE